MKMKTFFLITILLILVTLTLSPLLLMFRTSLRSKGSLFKSIIDLKVTDFKNNVKENYFGQQIEIEGTYYNIKSVQISDEFYQKITFKNTINWQTIIDQDLRKYNNIKFKISSNKSNIMGKIFFQDDEKNVSSIPLNLIKKNNFITVDLSDIDDDKLQKKYIKYLGFSFSTTGIADLFISDIKMYYKKYTLVNYIDVWKSGPFPRYFFNSAFIAIIITLGNMLFSSMVGYAFARRTFPLKFIFWILILGALMIPAQTTMVPMFLLMKKLYWLNTYYALIIPALVAPFNIFMMKQYIQGLPVSLEESGRIDGAHDFQIFFRIVLPLCKPALAVVGINTFLGAWNSFLYPFLLTNTENMRTLPVGLALFEGQHGANWSQLMAGSSISVIPIIIVFLIFQKYIISGLTAGAEKG